MIAARSAGDSPAGILVGVAVDGFGGIESRLLIAGAGPGKAGYLGTVERGGLLALGSFFEELLPDRLAFGIENG